MSTHARSSICVIDILIIKVDLIFLGKKKQLRLKLGWQTEEVIPF